jgi:hypothetical protein
MKPRKGCEKEAHDSPVENDEHDGQQPRSQGVGVAVHHFHEKSRKNDGKTSGETILPIIFPSLSIIFSCKVMF